MKTLSRLLDLNVAMLLAMSLCLLQCPLYFEDRTVSVKSPVNMLEPRPMPAESVDVQIWTSRKANWLTRFHFQNIEVYFEVWAKDQPTAIKKFRREFGKRSFETK
ncbi:MAG: hypothetical protein ABIN80_23035 [Dyadobacter sp.]|uniref:hypothetical protein n=1 Tax=Dyadobacter sp. TaxID=1914288 RepID=UPI0032631811